MTLSPLVLGWTLIITTFHPDDTVTNQQTKNLSAQECEDRALAASDRFNRMDPVPMATILCRPPAGYAHE